ncbi:MAG: hypothetical protein NVS4B3_12820 [Gemmatimonadaceae bacterium]
MALIALVSGLGCAAAVGGARAQTADPRATEAVPSDTVPRSLFLADLTSDELQSAIAHGFTTALVYSGATEGSGPHLALGKHNFRAPFYAERIARELGHTLVGQTVPFGVNTDPIARYPGTIAIRPETFAALQEDVLRSLARTGFTRIVLLTEHGGNVPVLQALAPRLDAALSAQGVRVVFASDNYLKSTAEIEAWGRAHALFAGRHGGLWDTSELWFIDSSKVRPTRLALGDTSLVPLNSTRQVTGDQRRSSPALGRLFADIRVNNGVAEIRHLLDALK